LAVDVSVDQLVNITVSFDLNGVDDGDIPFGEDQQLVELFGEVLDTQLNVNFDGEVGGGLVVQLLDVLTGTN